MNTALRARVLGTAVWTALPLALLPTTTRIDGQVASRGGDSGGPVFSLDGDGVRAKGILSGGNDGTQMVFQDWADVIRLYNAYPRTA